MSLKQYKNWIQEAVTYGKPQEVEELVEEMNSD